MSRFTEPEPPVWAAYDGAVVLDSTDTVWQRDDGLWYEPGLTEGETWGFLLRHRVPLRPMQVSPDYPAAGQPS